jgi:DNA-binding MarR family transcriptional regulator
MQQKVTQPKASAACHDAELLAQCALFDVHRLARLLTGMYNARMKDVPLSISQYTLVTNIAALEPARVTEVAAAMLMDRTSVTRLIEPLISRGVLKMEQDEDDRRARNLTVTKKGRAELERSEDAWQSAQKEFYDIVGSEKWMLLRKTLRDTVHLVRDRQIGDEASAAD